MAFNNDVERMFSVEFYDPENPESNPTAEDLASAQKVRDCGKAALCSHCEFSSPLKTADCLDDNGVALEAANNFIRAHRKPGTNVIDGEVLAKRYQMYLENQMNDAATPEEKKKYSQLYEIWNNRISKE